MLDREIPYTPFEGEVAKITLESFPCYFCCPPTELDDVEQKLTINKNGRVSFTSKKLIWERINYNEGRWIRALLQQEDVIPLLEKIIEPFRKEPEIAPFCTDVGSWKLTAYNTEGKSFKFEGCLFDDSFPGASELSHHIRLVLCVKDLFLFDGGYGFENYTYLSVSFEGSSKTYYYRTEDSSVAEGDTVLVPFGAEERVGVVEEVEIFDEDAVPFPLEKTKFILKKYE